MKKLIKVGMLGIGNVGRGTYQALEMNHKKIAETTGLDIEIVKILNRHPEKDRGIDIPKEKYTANVDDILTSLTTALLSNRFTGVHGILNGTTNYILTQMSEYGKDYAEVLKDAQDKGFAEADPTADVEGLDAANKLSILISLIFGVGASPDEIPTQGITSVGSADIQFAKEAGYTIKLLASARESDGKVYGNVEPVLLPDSHPLACRGPFGGLRL